MLKRRSHAKLAGAVKGSGAHVLAVRALCRACRICPAMVARASCAAAVQEAPHDASQASALRHFAVHPHTTVPGNLQGEEEDTLRARAFFMVNAGRPVAASTS